MLYFFLLLLPWISMDHLESSDPLPFSYPGRSELAVASDGQRVFGPGNDGHVYEIRLEDGQVLRRIPLNKPGRYYGIGVDKADRRLVVGTERSELLLVDLSTNKHARTIRLDIGEIYEAKVVDDHILVAGRRGPIQEINWKTGDVVRVYDKHGASNEGLDLTASGRYLLAGNHDGSIQYFDRKSGALIFELHNPFPNPDNGCHDLIAADISRDGRYGAVTGCGGRAIVIDLQKGDIQNSFEADPTFATDVSFSPNGKHLAVSLLNGEIQVFDLSSQALVRKIPGIPSNGLQFFISYAQQGKRLISLGPYYPLRIINTDNDQEIARIPKSG